MVLIYKPYVFFEKRVDMKRASVLVFVCFLFSTVKGDVNLEVLQTVSEVCQDAADVAIAPKQDKKQKKRVFFKRLICKVVTLALNVMLCGDKRSADVSVEDMSSSNELIKNSIIELCESLNDSLKACDLSFAHEKWNDVCLHCIFKNSTEDERLTILREKFKDAKSSDAFLRSVMSELFDHIAIGFSALEEHIRQKAVENLNNFNSRNIIPQDSTSLDSTSLDSVDFDDNCQFFSGVADSVSMKYSCIRSHINTVTVLAIVKIIADIGALVYKNKEGDRSAFIDGLVILLQDIRDFLSADNLLGQFEKLSSFLAKYSNAKTREELREITEGIVKSTQDGAAFIGDLFFSINVYVKKKLASIFSQIFHKTVPIVNGENCEIK